MMKPGAEKLYAYLQEHQTLLVADFKKVFATKATMKRMITEYPAVFLMTETEVQLKKEAKEEAIDYVGTRKSIHRGLNQFLVGPFEDTEELGEYKRPMQLYLTGKLVPFGSTSSVEDEKALGIETAVIIEEDTVEDRLSSRQMFRPSSMGFSFKLKKLTSITIDASWATYEGDTHKRMAHQLQWVINLQEHQAKGELNYNKEKINAEESFAGQIHYSWTKRNGLYHISVFLLNNYMRESYPAQYEIMFQTALKVSVQKEQVATFRSVTDRFNVADELLYREQREVAIGHGVGVDWHEQGTTLEIMSTWLPFYELPVVEHATIADETFSMEALSKVPLAELKEKLEKLPYFYEQWLKLQQEHSACLEVKLKEEAEHNIEQVHKIIARLKEGIALVVASEQTNEHKAFRFANEAMSKQRAMSAVAAHYRQTGKRIAPVYNGNWRLFQIIFVLMNIAGISDEQHEDREVVDLIWFPTGGGKTEAYLGVAAYAMAHRRLEGNVDDVSSYAGMTIFMRYTLRLLTTQQFQRAAALICAAEDIRLKNVRTYGDLPFSIGLWIGGDSSPNTLKDAQEKLEQLVAGEEVKKGNPMQLMNCPWCGTELTAEDYLLNEEETQQIGCHEPSCLFYKKLPIYTIDEAIYQHVPTLLIGTVDKIAQLPWKKDMYELFGRKDQYHPIKGFAYDPTKTKRGYKKIPVLKPPTLIIQDELHLISGPLGSITGLYEVAVDILTSTQGRPAKVIASTATIRGAKEQIAHLYGRDYLQFPMAVQKHNDTFVAHEVAVTEKPGRLYIGVSSPGVSNKIQAIQLFAALTTITRSNLSKVMDPYYTMLGYFNTVKELSGMLTTFQDEIVSRLDLLDPKKQFAHELVVEEMTSRKQAYEIPVLLSKMEQAYGEKGALDAVLATNMISVGVDVDRLGLMVVQGQPKTTSEYIQATSRVGRKYPGIVITNLNSMRSRDLSHFEQFKSYHQALYRHVEVMSVTPFTTGAIHKGLRGALVGLLRQTVGELAPGNAVNKFARTDEVEQLIQRFLKRAQATGLDTAELKAATESILEWWEETAAMHPTDNTISYKANPNNGKPSLLRQFDEKGRSEFTQPAMMSLRNVEGTIKVEVKKQW